MSPTITAFKKSPDRGKGLARDTRVRWAFEEVGQPYDVRPVTFTEMKESAHLALNSVEPSILDLVNAKIVESDKPWSAERLPLYKPE